MYQELQKGWIEVITGPMFAGKSEELIRRIKTLTYTKMKIMAFKPAIDNRYDKTAIASHDGAKYEAYAVKEAKSILELVRPDTQVVAIDEVQFFSNDIIGICESLADRGVRVIVAGLDLDFRGEPFGPMPELLARAEFVTKLTAVCTVCGCAATRTQRMINGKPADYNDPIIKVGAKESYEARCRKHHMVPDKPADL
ncbi:MAG: thymidine kinase [Bacilli bacterium]|jgi:thymidine kinase|nr:thymidine kinase [Bacilli bacterium]